MSKNEAINLMQNADLNEKKGTQMKHMKHKYLFSYVKMDKETLMFGNIEVEKNKFYRHKSPVPSPWSL